MAERYEAVRDSDREYAEYQKCIRQDFGDERINAMLIETDFTSGNITLSFESGKRVKLTRDETREFNERIRWVQEQAILEFHTS